MDIQLPAISGLEVTRWIKDDPELAHIPVVAVSAYVLYIVSEYVVLWFSRCREYYADRFAGNVYNAGRIP